MSKYEEEEKATTKKFAQKDKKKRKKMHQSGKSVFALQKLISNKNLKKKK